MKKIQIEKAKNISMPAKYIKIADKISNNRDLIKEVP